jgi:hypothetical protein
MRHEGDKLSSSAQRGIAGRCYWKSVGAGNEAQRRRSWGSRPTSETSARRPPGSVSLMFSSRSKVSSSVARLPRRAAAVNFPPGNPALEATPEATSDHARRHGRSRGAVSAPGRPFHLLLARPAFLEICKGRGFVCGLCEPIDRPKTNLLRRVGNPPTTGIA